MAIRMKQEPYVNIERNGTADRLTLIKHRLTNIININWVITIFYQEFGNNYDFKGERHNFWEMVYADKGELLASADGKEVLLHQGEVIFHKPNEFHTLKANGNVAPNAFIMSFDCHSPAMKYFHNKHVRLNAQQKKLIAMLLDESLKTFITNTTDLKKEPILGGRQMIRTYLEQLLILLMRGDESNVIFPVKDISDSHLVQEMIQLLEKHLYDRLTIDQISEKLNYSRTYLCNTFKRESGFSIIQYYTRLKIEESKKLLRENKLNISQISDKLGFCNPHYFSHTFKKTAHMSPREYQQSIQDRGLAIMQKLSTKGR